MKCRFVDKIIFSNEAHFQFTAFVNRHNYLIWGLIKSLNDYWDKMQLKRVTVWYILWSRWVIGSLFFENEVGNAASVIGERYHNIYIILQFSVHKLENMALEDSERYILNAIRSIKPSLSRSPDGLLGIFLAVQIFLHFHYVFYLIFLQKKEIFHLFGSILLLLHF